MTAQPPDGAPSPSNAHGVSSPVSTGGAGTFFEQHVDAFWLAHLLVHGIPPILLDCSVAQVNLQTEHLGWSTDDFLIIGQNGAGNHRKLAGQVKRTFTVSAADEDCKKAIGDFWHDFKNSRLFSQETDRFALVTLRGTKSLLEHFAELLESARAARDGTEFEHRLATTGFIAKKAVHYCRELCKIIGGNETRSVTPSEIWPFLRVLHVLSLDFHTATAQTEAMIKTLLAHTTTDSDAIGSADVTWNALLTIAAQGMSEARTFDRDALPEALRNRHSVLSRTDHKALRALKEHTELILRGIRSTIGADLHLRRGALVQQVLAQLGLAQVVLVSGSAGSGKSAVAKDAIELLSADYFTFAFRAEEFAQPHFDSTLQSGQIPTNAATLEAILAGQDRKVVLVESVERLLEKSTRDAFSDMLTLAAADHSLQIVLTCRDYSTDLVRASFLTSGRILHSVITIPPLDDSELAEVEASFPILARPLANGALRRVLRNPYFLDKALQISWSPDRPLPESERDFRRIFWQQVVRAEDRPTAGPPRLRQDVFEEVAVRRARALTAYVNSRDLDAAVVENLRRDSLLVSSAEGAAFVAPAHDVLEDWAILQWMEEQHLAGDGSFRALSEAIGGHPAVRRAYRRWVAELIDREPESADKLFDAALADGDVSAQFRDDTLVSLLRAPSSPVLLQRRVTDLLANDNALLKRVIHLLRVACVTTPTWLPAFAEQGSLFNVPDGPSWAPVLSMVQTHIQGIAAQDRMLLLGLVEDWARGVSWWSPHPVGAESAAAIAHSILPHLDVHYSKGAGQRTLKVLAKIPKADASRFEILLRGRRERDQRDHTSETFQDVVFAGVEGMPAARDLPDVLVSVATEYLLCSEDDLQERPPYYASPVELETLFGLKVGLRHDFFPASAYRGPWLPLLRYHPKKGVDFFIRVFNHSADWYAHPRISERVEPPFEIELEFPDRTSRKQWANPRLWNWYRGTSVGPYVLQSLLMALEQWLLEYAEVHPAKLDAILHDLLRRSDSAALTAVVASVGTAFPHAAGETLLVLLRSPSCIWLDRQRMAMESQAPSGLSGLLGLGRGENEIYEMERKQADARPHRRQDLESAIANLQLGPLASRVHEILDEHRRALPPVSQQTDEDRVWRLSMHRMDLREYTVTKVIPADADLAVDSQPANSPSLQIQMDPAELETDVKEMVDKSAAKLDPLNSGLRLVMWALHVFENKEHTTHDPATWHQQLEQARIPNVKRVETGELDLGRDGPGLVAAVCVRDHWQELSTGEQDWCVDIVCSEVMRGASVWDDTERAQRHHMSADRSCAWVISGLIVKTLSETQRRRVQEAFAAALTHPIDEVRWYAAWGIARQLSLVNRELTMRSVNALANEAGIVDEAWKEEKKGAYEERRRIGVIEAEAASAIRERFWQAGGIPDNAYQSLGIGGGFAAEANPRILAILSPLVTDSTAIASFARAAQTLVGWWDADDERKRVREERQERNPENESALSDILQTFVMRTARDAARTILQPALDAVDRHPHELHWFVRGLTAAEDRERNTEQFWFLWKLFADRVRQAKWVAELDDKHAIGGEMVSAIFLGSRWKDEVRHWKSLEGHSHNVHALFDDLPPSSVVLDDYIRFLYHIGEQSLPDSFVRISKNLQSGDAQRLLSQTNTVFMLEVLLQRHVYGRPLELKRNSAVRDSVLHLLDVLVENGSSAAFRMRDDFVTPVTNSNPAGTIP